jgi:hypothetical protein
VRRLGLLLLFIALFVAAFTVNRLVANWHYVIPVEAGKVAYIATFDSFNEDWNLSEGQLKSQIVAPGLLRINVGNVDSLPFAEVKQHFGDFDLRVQATATEGPENNGYGVIFRLQNKDNTSPDDDSFYLFMISSDGYYQLVRSVEGQARELSTWIPSPVVNTGIGATNHLRIVAKGNQFQFYVNGQPVLLCIPDDPDARSTYNAITAECQDGKMLDTLDDPSIQAGQIGVAAQSFDVSGVVVEFDNLVVYGPA